MIKPEKVVLVVQASPLEWSGAPAIALRHIDGKPIIYWVIEKLKSAISYRQIVVAAPDIPKSTVFLDIAQETGVNSYLGSSENVLERLIGAIESVQGEVFAKIIGQQYFIDIDLLKKMIEFLIANKLDYVQAPDGFDVHLWGEVATIYALKRAEKENSDFSGKEKKIWQVRPLTYIRTHDFKTGVYENVPFYSDSRLLEMREIAKKIYTKERTSKEAMNLNTSVGNAILNRYRLATNYIKSEDKVLDIACGYGYGSALLVEKASQVIGGDYSAEVIELAKKHYNQENLNFQIEDITSISFPNDSFDVVVSMETIDHVDEYSCLSELNRVLKAGGTLIISSHQNLHGHIPIVPWHLKEYSLQEFKRVLKKYRFEVIKIYGEKLGIISEDERGEYMIAVCKKAFSEN
jgi:ubiquinone/menaquinone biosynthesis C-methylase UbiE/spore coat polysaccharide biosynthesis protein SpsF (cytidylyltransferase family)